jgi:two-component system sensor histidine kinase BaeS
MLLSFLMSLFTFLSITAAIFYIGYKKSMTSWGNERRKTLEEVIQKELKDILSQGAIGTEEILESRLNSSLPNNVSIIIYDENRNVVFERRGSGMGRRGQLRYRGLQQNTHVSQSLIPVQVNEKVVGHYRIGPITFGINSANTRFLDSMKRTIWFGVGCAFVLAFLFALLISKRLSKSTQTVSSGINQMARGNISIKIPERGVKEISVIAKSANELGRRLEEEEKLRRQWAEDIAHDLRTPIAALKSQFEGMIDGVLELTVDRVVKNMFELLRIETLINELGELTRLESPEMKIHPVEIHTGNLFKELNDRFMHEFKKKELLVHWEKGVDSFSGDENLVLRAVSNIISNAIRHTPEGGNIRVAVRKDDESYILSVFNSGEGIPNTEIDKVFDRLYRGEYARNTPGSGLGLTISKRIAELHGGGATIKSDEHEGTTIELSIQGSHSTAPNDNHFTWEV